ncbi:MAG TPA: M3 family oligoendopeptidase [Bacteroidetes bacterium]|nr:M3 family oligoendopeptidase [Bacteroidota bacterium]
MTFSEFPYTRPDFIQFKKDFQQLVSSFSTSTDVNELQSLFEKIYSMRRSFDTAMTIVSIRNSVNTADEFYEKEQEFMDENEPMYRDLVMQVYKALINSSKRNELEKIYGTQLFMLAELSIKTFSTEIIEDLQKENQLTTEYTKLLASAKIEFQGNTYNLSGLVPFKQSEDRNIRREAHAKSDNWFAENHQRLDEIFDELVKLRHKMALKLGYKNFVELGYARMQRVDYNQQMVSVFRENVRKHLVPLSSELKHRQQNRLSLSDLKYYDEGIDFKTGNAKPHGNPDWIVNHATVMYDELSKETGEFFHFMLDSQLMDLVNKPNKAGGGYCTYLSSYKAPYIFSNFNGTSHDIDVLTHEAGHAFQAYRSRNLTVDEYLSPTLEACEIHSMSMEFIAWPWMEKYFEEQTEKYKYAHLTHALMFIPYGVAVDEFQHFIYKNPDATPQERNAAWRRIEKKYLPLRDYDGNNYLENGGFWQRQMHIYRSPFYYIDYTLAQICAFQFWKKSRENLSVAMKDYITLCDAGGSMSFLKLVELAKIKSPFEEQTMMNVMAEAKSWLSSVDDMKL